MQISCKKADFKFIRISNDGNFTFISRKNNIRIMAVIAKPCRFYFKSISFCIQVKKSCVVAVAANIQRSVGLHGNLVLYGNAYVGHIVHLPISGNHASAAVYCRIP